MIKVRVEFLNETERCEFIEHIEKKYLIVERDKIKESKKEGSRFKFQFLSLVKKEEVNY